MFTPLIALLLLVTSDPQGAPPAANVAAPVAPPTAAAPTPRVPDGEIAAWVVEGLTRDSRNRGESADALLLRNGRRPDLAIASEVTDRLTAAGVQGMVVACADGSIVLRGNVSDAARREKAGALAGDVPGVRSVSNLFTLPGGAPAVEQAKSEPLEHVAEAGPARTVAFGFVTRDRLAGRGIVVDVTGGVVRLTGQVSSTAARDYAIDAAGRVPGVRAVESALAVRAGSIEDDRRLALLVQRRLANDVVVQTVSNAILVTVDQGVLRLAGSVRDDDQRAQAERLAAALPEVFTVVNELGVDENLILPPKGRIAGFKLWNDF